MLRKTVVLLFSLASIAGAQELYVDINAQPGGNGSHNAPFNSIETAVAYANGLPGIPNIRVAPGHYPVSATLLVQKTMIIQGSNRMNIDAQGFPTGADPLTESRIVGTAALGANTLVEIGNNGNLIPLLQILNLSFEAGPGGGDIMNLTSAQGFVIRDCVFVGSSALPAPTNSNGIRTYASSGEISGSYMTGVGAGAIARGGSPASPAIVAFHDNRSVGNKNGGVLLAGTSDGVLASGNELYATVWNNDLSSSVATPVSFGIRIFVKGDEDPVNAQLTSGHITAVIWNNQLVGNSVGASIDSGFTYRLVPPIANMVCDNRTFTGTLDLTFLNNTVAGSTNLPGVISFTRQQTTLGQPNSPQSSWQYLHNAVYSVIDPQHLFAGAKVDNPVDDPFVGGPCAADVVHEALNNSLTINGVRQSHTP